MDKKRILTGDRPTGRLHLGHYVGSLLNRVKLQHEYDTFIIIADIQALTTNFEHPENLKRDIKEVTLDYLAVGIDPNISTIFIQSMIPELAELTSYYSMFTTVNTLRHNPTLKTEAKERGYDDLMYGFLGYPISQAADISIFKAHLVPVGQDQVPHIELTRKIVRRFNELYKPVLVEPEALISEISRLIGLDGNSKMSKSLNNAIFLSDTHEKMSQLVRTAVTDPARIHADDPGHPDICTIYAYHNAFNKIFVPELETACKAGKIGCVACKNKLTTILNEFLEPIRNKRKQFEKNPGLVDEILIEGTKKARKVACATIEEVRETMHLNYFK
ncbi:MAG: tryptophan--tRNA ligase [Candidatus Firestonebacteria bacterium]|nr:tryptophan--tRNA ligase [Candidatus Firestonebacteria bacterium]